MVKIGYFVESGSMGLKSIDTLMLTFGPELLTSYLIETMDDQLRVQYLNALACGINSQIVHISGDGKRTYYPVIKTKK